MGIDADFRDSMIDLYQSHKNCDADPYPCNVGDEFMDYMSGWINQ